MAYKEISGEEFDETVRSATGPVVVDFWAPWCGPCKLFGPVFEEVSNELKGFLYLKVNTDNAQELASRYNIRSIPTVIVFRGGIELERFTGVFNKEQFIEKLKKFID